MLGPKSYDRVVPVVPLFHANGWTLAFSAPLKGAALVLPGPRMDGVSIHQLLQDERVNMTAAVPTVWLMLLQHLEATGGTLDHLERVVIGGSACPRTITEKFQDNCGVDVIHAWGITETSPLGSLCTFKPEYEHLTGAAKLDLQEKQGHPPFTVEMRVVGGDGAEVPWDGKTFGRLQVRGPASGGRSLFQG